MNLKPSQLKQIVKKLIEQAKPMASRINKPKGGGTITKPMSRKGGGTIGRHPGKGVPKPPTSQTSGCLDPVSDNFCATCPNDCMGNPAAGVQTGIFGWNWSSNNDDLGDTSCCQY